MARAGTTERNQKVRALAKRAGTAGEQQAAEAALVRLKPTALTVSSLHLTDAIVRKLTCPPGRKQQLYWDATLGSFGIRVTATGAKSFLLDYRTKGGRHRRGTIGAFPNWGTAAARSKAREWRRLIDDGGDPLADLEDERSAPTMAELIARFRTEHLPKKRERTREDYESMLTRYIAPHFGNTKVAEVTYADVERLHRKLTAAGYPYRANRVADVLRKMLALAVRWNMIDSNPAQGVERNKEHHRRRYLNDQELAALLKALEGYPDRRIADALYILLHTGARRGEVLAMEWSAVDFDKALWSKPPSSTKQKEHHQVPLSVSVLQVLRDIRAQQSEGGRRVLPTFVFPGSGERGHVVEIKKAWRRICKEAGLKNARIHDLRHTHASVLVSAGHSLPLVGSLLGHATPSTTQRYAHLAVTPQRAAVEQFAAIIAGKDKR